MKNKLFTIRPQILLALCLIIFELFISGPLLKQLHFNRELYLTLFKLTELSFGIITNILFFHQRIYWKLTLSKRITIFSSFIIIILAILSFHWKSHFIFALTISFLAAFSEEYIFRGIILTSLMKAFKNKLNKCNVLFCVITTSFLFGLCHLENLISQDPLITLIQVIQTIGMGCLLCTLYIRKGSILLPIFIHFSIDFVGIIGKGNLTHKVPSNSIALILQFVIPLLIYLLLSLLVLNIKTPSKWNLVHLIKNTRSL